MMQETLKDKKPYKPKSENEKKLEIFLKKLENEPKFTSIKK